MQADLSIKCFGSAPRALVAEQPGQRNLFLGVTWQQLQYLVLLEKQLTYGALCYNVLALNLSFFYVKSVQDRYFLRIIMAKILIAITDNF